MQDFFCKFVEHLFFVLLCLILFWYIRKMCLLFLKKVSTSGWLFINKIDLIKSGKFDVIFINHRKLKSTTLLNINYCKLGHIDVENELVHFRLMYNDLDTQENIKTSLYLVVKLKDIPINFLVKILWFILIYKISPNSIKNGGIKIKLTNSMIFIINEKIADLENIKFNLKL